MSEPRYEAARRIFGGPAYYHKHMDARVYSEVGDSDVVVVGDPKMHKYVWDASAVDRRYTE
jgi:lipopolysaccharide export system protein LptC